MKATTETGSSGGKALNKKEVKVHLIRCHKGDGTWTQFETREDTGDTVIRSTCAAETVVGREEARARFFELTAVQKWTPRFATLTVEVWS